MTCFFGSLVEGSPYEKIFLREDFKGDPFEYEGLFSFQTRFVAFFSRYSIERCPYGGFFVREDFFYIGICFETAASRSASKFWNQM